MKYLIKTYWKENCMIFTLMLCAGLSTTMVSFINASILDALINMDFNNFFKSIINLMITFTFFLLFTFFHIRETAKTIQKMSKHLRSLVINKLDVLTIEEFRQRNQGTYVSWLNNDINQIEQAGFTRFYELLLNSITLTLALVALAYIHWLLIVLAILEVILIIKLPSFFGKKLRTASLNVASINEISVAKSTNLLSGFTTFYVFNNLSYMISELKKQCTSLESAKNKQSFLLAKVAILGGLGNVVGQISAYTLSGFLALRGGITIGTISATSSLSGNIFNTVGNLSQYLASIQGTEPLIQKIIQFSTKDAIKKNNDIAVLSTFQSEISFENVSFGYSLDKMIINNLSYNFKLHKKYAIEGKSGAGKSTILNMIIKNLCPTHGKIKVDNIDIKNIQQKSILSQIAIIEQKPYVFNGTIRDNICLGDNFKDFEVTDILNYVGLSEYANNLDLIISESGNNFSGGQRQRLALARGLIRNKNILLLDESTSNLDKQTALKIESFILDMPNVTVIMISHHLEPSIKEKLDDILQLT